MSKRVIDYLEKKSQIDKTLKAASEKVDRMERRAQERAQEQAAGGQKKRRLPKDFLDSFRDELAQRREKLEIEQVSDQVSKQVPDQVIAQVLKQVTGPPNRHSDEHPNRHPNEHSQYVVGDNTFNIKMKGKPIELTDRQYLTLHYIYFNRPFKVKGINGIGSIMKMGFANARNQIRSLMRKGYIFKPYGINVGPSGLSTCRVNNEKCVEIFGPTTISNPPAVPETSEHPSRHPTGHPNEPQKLSNSSSSLIKETTTKKNIDVSAIQRELDHPAMTNWKKWGLRAGQISKWLKSQPDVGLDDILLSLRHIEFQFVDQEYLDDRKAKGDPIRDIISWFWATFKERGMFIPEPDGYISWEQKRLNQITAAKEKQKKNQEALLCIELEAELDRIMSQPESDEFIAVFNSMATFNQNKYKRAESRNTEFFRVSMMNGLKKLKGCDDLRLASNQAEN